VQAQMMHKLKQAEEHTVRLAEAAGRNGSAPRMIGGADKETSFTSHQLGAYRTLEAERDELAQQVSYWHESVIVWYDHELMTVHTEFVTIRV